MNRLNDIKKQLENEKQKLKNKIITDKQYIINENKLKKDLNVIGIDINNIEKEKNNLFKYTSNLEKEIHEANRKNDEVKKRNLEKIESYKNKVNFLNNGALQISKEPFESDDEYLNRLKNTGQLFSEESIYNDLQIKTIKDFKMKMKELTRNDGLIEEILKLIPESSINDITNKLLIIQNFSIIKEKFIKRYGYNNPNLKSQNILNFFNDMIKSLEGKDISGINSLGSYEEISKPIEEVYPEEKPVKDISMFTPIPKEKIDKRKREEPSPSDNIKETPMHYTKIKKEQPIFSPIFSPTEKKLIYEPIEEKLIYPHIEVPKVKIKSINDGKYEFATGVDDKTGQKIPMIRLKDKPDFHKYTSKAAAVTSYVQDLLYPEYNDINNKDTYHNQKYKLTYNKIKDIIFSEESGKLPPSGPEFEKPYEHDEEGMHYVEELGGSIGIHNKYKEIPNKVQFGSLFLLYKKLYYDNILSVRNKYNQMVTHFPAIKVSENFVTIINQLLNNQKPDLHILSHSEKILYDALIYVSHLDKHVNNSKKDTINDLKKRLRLIEDEINAGNDSNLLKQELKDIIYKLFHFKNITKKQLNEYLKQL